MDEIEGILDEVEREDVDELFEHYRFVADKGQGLLRIDKFLANRIENISRSKIQEAAEGGNIFVNDKPVKPNYKVKPLEVVTIMLTFPPREIEIIPQDIPINIVYEDDDLLIVNKEPGMVVHPSYGHYTGTLINALAFHLKGNSLFESDDIRPGLVHRIDKDTSGLLVIAKNLNSKVHLAKQFFDHSIERKYVALVWGNPDLDTGTISGNIGRSLKDRKVMTVFPKADFGKAAVTHYSVIERFSYVSLIECKLETGRTHQIRAHMRYIGHPLFNDETYGGNEVLKGTTFAKYKQFVANCFEIIPRQALHAKTLGFIHPSTGLYVSFESDLPDDLTTVIEKWRNYSKLL